MAPKVLIILSSHDKMGSSGKPTGWYLPEFAHPYYAFEGKADMTIASPAGGAAPLDPSSVEASKEDAASVKFLKDKESLWKNTSKLSSFLGKADQFDAIFYVGGHGPMFDLATSKDSQELISEFWNKKKVVSAVCHGPAVFKNVKIDGEYLVAGQEVTGFTNTEEDQMGLSQYMPFMLETELDKASGGNFVKADQPWGPKIAVAGGGRLITGQNPASAEGVGKAILRAVSA